MKKTAMVALLALIVLPAASFADAVIRHIKTPAGSATVIRAAPPAAVLERHGAAPHRGFVWIPGYQRWVGGRYVWIRGRWARPPHAGAVWVPHRWVHRGGTWVLVGGRWR